MHDLLPALQQPQHRTRAATRKPAPSGTRGAAASKDAGTTPRLTHPDRVVYPADGVTKQQVFDYYQTVMPWLLPEIRDRPLSVLRCTDGVNGACFFQKHVGGGLGRSVQSVPIEEADGGIEHYIVVRDARGVLELVQFNAIEFHPWGATVRDPERADRIVFDLDPAPGVSWQRVVEAAFEVRARLAALQLQSFARLSGGKGLHVVLPLKPATPWERARQFAHGLASALAASAPQDFIATASKKQREGRIFVDYLRNTRGATSVASYSLRARDGAGVAMPVSWQELRRMPDAAAFDVHSALERLKRRRSDPWAGLPSLRQKLETALKKLERG